MVRFVGPLGQPARKNLRPCEPARAHLSTASFSSPKSRTQACVLCLITWRQAHKRARLVA